MRGGPALDPGATAPGLARWPRTDPRFRRWEGTVPLGPGEARWARAAADVLRWRVKTASGFVVRDDRPATVGARLSIEARVAGLVVREPVEVVAVISRDDRVGFAYRTLPGHPVEGEEAFVVHREDGIVRLTVRSLTRPSPAPGWRALYPALRLAQAAARRRYLRALRAEPTDR